MKYLLLFEAFDQDKIDNILDKISDIGYDNLSQADKDYLANAFGGGTKEQDKPIKTNNMTTTELQEKKELLDKLTYEISEYEPDFPELDWDDIKFWIEVHDEDGCLYDGGDLTYYLKSDLPKGMYEEIDGMFTYKGDLTKNELIKILDNIFDQPKQNNMKTGKLIDHFTDEEKKWLQSRIDNPDVYSLPTMDEVIEYLKSTSDSEPSEEVMDDLIIQYLEDEGLMFDFC
jgi:hypothetical protein